MQPQQTITRKGEIKPIIESARRQWPMADPSTFADWLTEHLLYHRVKFPLLEFTATELDGFLPRTERQEFVSALSGRPEHGSSVIIGKLLQQWLSDDLPDSFGQARQAIILGDTWYHCDHIGERVFGHGLLTHYTKARPLLTAYLDDQNSWVQRAVGVAAHYATKKGLEAPQVETILSLLLTKAHTKDYEVQRGVGWGLKTIAKFHPEMMRAQLDTLPADKISAPVRRKIETGFGAAQKRRQG